MGRVLYCFAFWSVGVGLLSSASLGQAGLAQADNHYNVVTDSPTVNEPTTKAPQSGIRMVTHPAMPGWSLEHEVHRPAQRPLDLSTHQRSDMYGTP